MANKIEKIEIREQIPFEAFGDVANTKGEIVYKINELVDAFNSLSNTKNVKPK